MVSITYVSILILVSQVTNGYFNPMNKFKGGRIDLSKAIYGKGIYMSTFLESEDAADTQLLDFSRLISDEGKFDAQDASRLHLESILTLIKSDIQNREDHEGGFEKHTFPKSYSTALKFIADQTALLKVDNNNLCC